MLKAIKKAINLLRDFWVYFYKGWQAGLIGSYVKFFISSLLFHLNRFRHVLYSEGISHHTIRDEKIKKLQDTSKGLHSLLMPDSRFSYSIMIKVSHPKLSFFRTCLESVLDQSSRCVEILIGLVHSRSHEIEEMLLDLQRLHPSKIRVFDFSKLSSNGCVIQKLAEEATGNFLFIMGEEDWIRPDLLFRYEQTLRIFTDPENRVLYCDLNGLSDRNAFIPANEYKQPKELNLPYLFKRFRGESLLVPRELWKSINPDVALEKGAEDEDLLLRLDLAGAKFQHIPFSLYSVRVSSNVRKAKSQEAFLEVLDKYTKGKKLDWEWSSGYQANSARAVPLVKDKHIIQAVIPFKDQKDLTIKCIRTLLKQKGVQVKITAVDNRSVDPSIAEEIRELGGEVISVDEPFNYSRLNNLAVEMTESAADCDVLLFLNNDVELDAEALNEMLRWIDQPHIGMVGCRLNYPDGRLQHGGVGLTSIEKNVMRWEHIEKLRPFEEMDQAKTLGTFDAVTAACAMIKRQIFLDAGGFDEVWYPIGYSDTHLAVKLAAHGLKCFYTPYAVGIHHESVSRKSTIEDYENSHWLHNLLIKENKIKSR